MFERPASCAVRILGLLLAVMLTPADGAAGQSGDSLLPNSDFEQGTFSEVTGWSMAFYPQIGDDIHRCVIRSDERAKSGKWSLKIDTGPVLGKETDLVFGARVSGDSHRLAGRAVVLSGWVYVEPGTAVRPIGMRVRAFGENRGIDGDFMGDALEEKIVGTPGKWVPFRTMGTVPEGGVTSVDLHCFLRPDVVRTVQYLDDVRLEEYSPPPLQVNPLRDALWRDETALPVEAQVRADQPAGETLAFRLMNSRGSVAAQWKRPGKTGILGLSLPAAKLPEGRYELRADLRSASGNALTTTSAPIFIAASPWEGAPPARPVAHRASKGIAAPESVQGENRREDTARHVAAPKAVATLPADFQAAGTVAPTDAPDVVPADAEPLSPDTDLTEANRRGYAVFSRHPLDPVSRRGRPRPGEMGDIRLFACPGQYEPAGVSVWAIQAQAGVRVSVGDLVGLHGTLPANCVDVRVVRTLRNLPSFLEKRPAVDIPAGQTQTFWLTLFTPSTASPGFYSGAITIAPAAGPASHRRLLVRVLPLHLASPQKGYGFWWVMDRRWHGYYSSDPAQALEQTRKQFIMLREHGCNIVSLYSLPVITRQAGAAPQFDFSRDFGGDRIPLADTLRLGRETGFFSPTVPLQYPGADLLREYGPEMLKMEKGSPAFDDLYREVCRQIDRWSKDQGYTLAFAPVDEIGNSPDRRVEALRYYRLATEAGVLTSVTDNSPESGLYCTGQARFADVMKMRLYNCLLPDMIPQTRRSGGDLWLYNLGSGGWDAKTDRFTFGLFTERCGAKGHVQWAFQWPENDDKATPYELSAAGKKTGYHYALPAPDGPLPTLALEGVRAGIDDARYLALVERRSPRRREALLGDIEANSTRIDDFLRQHSGNFFDIRRWSAAKAAMEAR